MLVCDIQKELGELADCIEVEVLPECTSTNLMLKEQASALPTWHTLIALQQTQGRGRLGRSFYSPAETGLYMSILLRPTCQPQDVPLITAAAAVAVCRALERMGSDRAEIKWVNDVFIHGKKVCGILAESNFLRPAKLEYVILGIGINIFPPSGGFPPDLAQAAGAVFPSGGKDLRARLAALILRELYVLCTALPERNFVQEYRQRSFLIGAPVNVLSASSSRYATVIDIDDRCRLRVRYDDGTEESLFSGEVSIRLRENTG